MSLAGQSCEIEVPYKEITCHSIKSFTDLFSLLTTPTKRQAKVVHKTDTIRKSILTLLSAILMNSGLDAGQKMMNMIQNILYSILQQISDTENNEETLEMLMNALSPERRGNSFSVHRTTVDDMLPEFTRRECDKWLEDIYLRNMDEISKFNGRSKQITLCLDETPETVHTKYQNGTLQYIHVGQKSTWEKGFEYNAYYDATHQLFLGLTHHDKYFTDAEKRHIRPWIQSLIQKVQVVNQAGCDVKIIEGDRGYYQAEVFAAAPLGLFTSGTKNTCDPRLVIPRKFTREKTSFKWDYLLDTTRGQVFMDYMKLNPYTHPGLKDQVEGIFEKTSDYRYKIPFACVALIDEYSNKNNRTLAEVREEARKIQKKLDIFSKKLAQAEKKYLTYLKAHRSGDPHKPGYGRGRKRTKFLDDYDKANYNRCLDIYDILKRIKGQKTALLKSLMFIAISIFPGEDPCMAPKRFIRLAQDYHERWGIERGFEDTKIKFMRDARSRKPTKRQLNVMIGMCLYNQWHVERLRQMLEIYRDDVWNRVPWDPQRPWIRRRLERQFHGMLSADSYLLHLIETGVKYEIKKILRKKE